MRKKAERAERYSNRLQKFVSPGYVLGSENEKKRERDWSVESCRAGSSQNRVASAIVDGR